MKHQKDIEWTSLEIASKLFPATWSFKDPKVFRLSCELYEEVDPTILQQALDKTIDDYPLYRSVLKRGLFWYYLEDSDIKPNVSLESNSICAPIYVGKKSALLFRVFFYKHRINLEIFHALADGTGALRFLQTLVYHYFKAKQQVQFDAAILVNDHASLSGTKENSFDKYFVGDFEKTLKPDHLEKAYQLRGTRLIENRLSLIEGAMSVQGVLKKAHQYQTTLTIFLTSLFIYAIGNEMSAKKKVQPVVLTVPVNLRQYFQSVTARNFFSYINIGYRFKKSGDSLEDVITHVSKLFQEQLTLENLNDVSNKYLVIEQNLVSRIIPLPLKDMIIRFVTRLARKQSTSSLSNLGVITMPKEFDSYIRQFSFCTSGERPQMTLCTFGDQLVVSITSPYLETDIQKVFFQLIAKAGIEIELSTNL